MAAQPHVSPTPRQLRAQAVQRLQVGLFGLTLMLLIVGLANIIMQHARVGDVAQAASRAEAGDGSVSGDPLADFGVVPSPDGTSSAGKPAAASRARAH